MQAESRCRLIRLTAPSEKVISMLVRLRSQADCWTVSKGMLLTLEVLLWLLVTLVKLQEEQKLSISPKGLPTLLLRQ